MDTRQPRPPPEDPSPHPVDPDLALLEAYLDGELTTADLMSLQRRLHADGELSAALSRLSSEYAVRQAVFTSLQGTNADGERLARGVLNFARQAGVWERSRRYLRAGAVAAACVVCFAAGWVGRGSPATAAVPARAVPGTAEPVGSEAFPADPPLVYQVALTDGDGNITAVQKFDSLDEARSFAADVGRWQARQAEPQPLVQPALLQSGL